jgi:predicted DNA-binding ArsR family transcriptional regulator
LFVAKDSQLMSKLNDLLNKTQTREENVENVRDKLNKKVFDIESSFQNMLKSLQPVTEENLAQQE